MGFDVERFGELGHSWNLHYLEQVDSTNAYAKRVILQEAADSGGIYLADYQTAGVGRRGSKWRSTKGENLLFSIVLQTGMSEDVIPRLALATGVAIADVLSSMLPAHVKWPNDVYLRGKKVAGVLVEHIDDFTVIGVGLNVNQDQFDADPGATSLALELGVQQNRESLLAKLADSILKWGSLCVVNFTVVREYFSKIDYLRDAKVAFLDRGLVKRGIARGIDEHGQISIELDNELRQFSSIEELQKQ